MEQMTVEKLFNELKELVKKGQGDKKIIVADDQEGNSYHSCYYSVVVDPEEVKELVEASNGVDDRVITDYTKFVIIG